MGHYFLSLAIALIVYLGCSAYLAGVRMTITNQEEAPLLGTEAGPGKFINDWRGSAETRHTFYTMLGPA